MAACTQLCLWSLSFLVAVCLIKLTFGYSYRNCIEYTDHISFRCMNRKAKNVIDFVKDLRHSAITLNISCNNLTFIPKSTFAHLQNLTSLHLGENNISKIEDQAFDRLNNLQSLNISGNTLTKLNPSTFQGLSNLKKLLLSKNQLESLPLMIFTCSLETLDVSENNLNNFSKVIRSLQNLRKLKKLDLSFNKLESLGNSERLPDGLSTLFLNNNKLKTLGCHSEFLSRIFELDFSYNLNLTSKHFKNINLSKIKFLRFRSTNVSVIELFNLTTFLNPKYIDFSGLNLGYNKNAKIKSLCQFLTESVTQIQKMRLMQNSIQDLQARLFSNCSNFSNSLDLSFNKLRNVGCLEALEGQNGLRDLKVEHNILSELNSCENTTSFLNLTDLSYRYNRILVVKKNAFRHTPNLKNLYLNINTIASLDVNAFCGLEGLTTLRLDNNLLTDLNKDSFSDLHSLEILLLRNNQISVIFNDPFHSLGNLIILDLGGNKISHFWERAFNGLKRLENLYLDGNRLTTLKIHKFSQLSATLRVLDLQGNFIRYLTNYIDPPFVNLSRLGSLKLDAQRPHGITVLPNSIFSGLQSLTTLTLQNNFISTFGSDTFSDLSELEQLNLDDSGIGVKPLPPGIFQNLHKLKKLSVENMGIESLSKDVFANLTALLSLNLNRNAMLTIDPVVLSNLPNLTYLDLRGTPLSCTCKNSELQNWTVDNTRVQIVYLYSMKCPDQSDSSLYNFDTRVCYADIGLYLFASTSSVVFLLTILPLLYVKLYWKLKYTFYVFRSWFGEQWRRLRDEERKWAYDAFISYNSADEDWVLKALVPNLEGNGSCFRLCLHHRDFEPGRYIVDNIVSSVYNSRKTVCVVSQHFLRSEWCSLEIQLASYLLFHELRDVLVLVFLEHIPKRQISAYHRMRKVMLKKTYLQWPEEDCEDLAQAQELFWTQLRRALRRGATEDHAAMEESRDWGINGVTDPPVDEEDDGGDLNFLLV